MCVCVYFGRPAVSVCVKEMSEVLSVCVCVCVCVCVWVTLQWGFVGVCVTYREMTEVGCVSVCVCVWFPLQ